MKAFLEEYGLVIVVIIVVAVLIGLAVYFSQSGKEKITNTYTNFTNGADEIVTESMNDVKGFNPGGAAGGGEA